jgi:hypothetical protein
VNIPKEPPATPSTPRTRRSATIALIAVFVLVSASAGLVLAEGLVRVVAPQQLIQIRPDLWQPVDTVGWTHRPNAALRINTGERTVSVFTDREGYRVGESGRREAQEAILLLGDSFMEALQVEHEQTLAHLLESGVSNRIHQPVVVRNSGVGGWGPNQYLLRARQVLAREKPAFIVVALFVGNDVATHRVDRVPPRAPVQRSSLRLPSSFVWNELVNAFLAPVNDALETRSHLFIMAKNQASTIRMRLGLTPKYFPVEYLRDQATSPRWQVTTDIARDIAAEARARGVPTLFILVPEVFQVYDGAFDQYLRGFGIDPTTVDVRQPSRVLYESFTAANLHVIDALPAFRAAASNGDAPLFGEVDTHLSPAGHAALAELVVPAVAEVLRGHSVAEAGGRPRHD